jgi:hypothetical protein
MSQAPEGGQAHRSHPCVDPEAKFTPRDFANLIEKLPEDCALAGQDSNWLAV